MGTNREAPTLNLCTGTVNFTEKFDFKIISGFLLFWSLLGLRVTK